LNSKTQTDNKLILPMLHQHLSRHKKDLAHGLLQSVIPILKVGNEKAWTANKNGGFVILASD